MDYQERIEIISAYANALQERRHMVADEADLPYPRERIGEALLAELREASVPDMREVIEMGYVQLASFLPSDDYRRAMDYFETVEGVKAVHPEASEGEVMAQVSTVMPETAYAVQAMLASLEEAVDARRREVEVLRGPSESG